MKHEIHLSDGAVISSGTGALPAVVSVSLTQWANQQEALTYGGVYADVLELELFATQDILQEGQAIELWQDGAFVGKFYVQKPQRKSALRLRCAASDAICLLDKDLSAWFAALDGWPYTMGQLASLVCQECGIELAGVNFPGASLSVEGFSASRVTGRQILGWIAQAAGRFCRINALGQLEFQDYTPTDLYLGDREDHLYRVENSVLFLDCPEITASLESGELSLSWDAMSTSAQGADVTLFLPRQCYYYQNTLTLGQQTLPPEKVQLRKTQNDVGVLYPPDLGEAATYVVQGDPLLASASQQDLSNLARELYDTLQQHSYTPGKVTLPAGVSVMPGQVVKLCHQGKLHRLYVMKKTLTGHRVTLESTAKAYDSSPLVNESRIADLSGKLLTLEMGLEGLRTEHSDGAGKVAALELSVEGLSSRVEAQDQVALTRISALEQDEQALRLRLETVETNGVSQVTTATGYTFSQDGLRIQKSGQEMENLLDHTGMYVRRSGEVILRASSRGVDAVDVTVGNYLTVGHARFEQYESGRTACYFIGE